MLADKLDAIARSGADTIVTGDVSCLLHMNSGLARRGQPGRVRYVADLLAEGIRGRGSG